MYRTNSDQIDAHAALFCAGLNFDERKTTMTSVMEFAHCARQAGLVPDFEHVRVDETGLWVGVRCPAAQQLLAMVCVFGTHRYPDDMIVARQVS